MCRFYSSSVEVVDDRLARFMAIIGAVSPLYSEWSRVQQIHEARLQKESELRRDRARMKMMLTGFEQALAAQVGVERARAQAFIAALQALGPIQDPQATLRLLEISRELLMAPFNLPVMVDEGRR